MMCCVGVTVSCNIYCDVLFDSLFIFEISQSRISFFRGTRNFVKDSLKRWEWMQWMRCVDAMVGEIHHFACAESPLGSFQSVKVRLTMRSIQVHRQTLAICKPLILWIGKNLTVFFAKQGTSLREGFGKAGSGSRRIWCRKPVLPLDRLLHLHAQQLGKHKLAHHPSICAMLYLHSTYTLQALTKVYRRS